MQQPTAIAASLEDYDRSVASLVVAFICDPFIRWMFPDSKQYLHYFPLVLKYFAGRAFEHSMPIRLAPKDTIGGSLTGRQTLPVVAAPSFWALTG